MPERKPDKNRYNGDYKPYRDTIISYHKKGLTPAEIADICLVKAINEEMPVIPFGNGTPSPEVVKYIIKRVGLPKPKRKNRVAELEARLAASEMVVKQLREIVREYDKVGTLSKRLENRAPNKEYQDMKRRYVQEVERGCFMKSELHRFRTLGFEAGRA